MFVALPYVSVIVCTHNRSAQLKEACAAILAVDYPPDSFEVVIVNNASTDDTGGVADEIAREHAHVRVVDEPVLGLSSARNAGLRHARGALIAFGDDDAFPDRGWLRALADALKRENVLVAGGPVEPIFQGELPLWFSERFLPYLAVWDKGPNVERLSYNEYPRGNNIAFRREVFERFGTFSTHLGRKGNSLLSCEETEICLRVEREGGLILYIPEARVRHMTIADRVTPEWLARRFFAQGESEAIVEWSHAGWRGLWQGWSRWVVSTAHSLVRREAADAAIYARCQRNALAGYSRGVMSAPLRVPRYRPSNGSKWIPWT